MNLAKRLLGASQKGEYVPTSYVTGYRFPTQSRVASSDDYSFSNLSNAYADDDTYATAPASPTDWLNTEGTDTVTFYNFGFDRFQIPDGATITGIYPIVGWENPLGNPFPLTYNFQLTKDAFAASGDGVGRSFTGGVKDSAFVATDETWGASITPSDLWSENFGIRFYCSQEQLSEVSGSQARLQYIKLRIYYDY